MGDGLGERAGKKTIYEMIGHVTRDFGGGDGGAVNEAPALRAMADEAAVFHLPQHGGDGGVGELGAAAEGCVDGGDRGLGLVPQDFEDAELEVTEAVGGWLGPGG